MNNKLKTILKIFFRIAVTLVLLIWIFGQINLHQFEQTLQDTKWRFVIAVWLVALITFCLSTVKMKLILKKQKCDIGIITLLRASFITSFYAMIMPGLLSTSVKWYILKMNTGKGTNILSSMIYNQFSEIFIMTAFAIIALIFANPLSVLPSGNNNHWFLPVSCGIFLIVLIFIPFFLLNSGTNDKIKKFTILLLKPLPTKVHQKVREIFSHIDSFKIAGYRFHLVMALFTILTSVIGAVILYTLAARAANISIPWSVFVWLSAVIYILGRIPISIANLGVRETMLVTFLVPCGVEPSAALLMSMVLFSATILMAVIGAACQLKSISVLPRRQGSPQKRT